MILPDVNLLVYAYNRDAPLHDAAREWWEDVMSGSEPVALAWVVVLGFVRLMSNPRVLLAPMDPASALAETRSWLATPQTRLALPGPGHMDVLASLLEQPLSANLVTDAHLAALAIESQAVLCSNGSDFSCFSGLKLRNPLTGAPAECR